MSARRAAWFGVFALASIATTWVAFADAPKGKPVRERLGTDPFVTTLAPVSQVEISGGGTIGIDAGTCRACHPDNYSEWNKSTHRYALRDPQYLAELAKDSSPRWLCLNCHIPNANQRDYLVDDDTRLLSTGNDLRTIDKRDNPRFDKKLQREAITCATCHVRPGKNGLGVIIGPRGDTQAPHVTRADKQGLHDVCLQCHSPGHSQLTPTFVCWFETSEELGAGPYAGKNDCVDCHMPLVERSVTPGSPVRQTRQHHWLGGGVPTTYGLYGSLVEHGWRPGLDVDTQLDGTKVSVTLRNERAGHKIPTADPERHFLVRARLLDDKGAELARATERIGQQWDYGDNKTNRVAHRVQDNRLGPKESRVWKPALPAAAFARAKTIVIDALHVRLSPDNAAYAMKATVDAELEALVPGAGKAVAKLDKHYPLMSFVAREEIVLATGARAREDERALVARSRALKGQPLETLARELLPTP
jgi:nitrate reductase cytochrome c-type subunit